jgi:oxygen-independent coproporphyrinogen-3 oxidase
LLRRHAPRNDDTVGVYIHLPFCLQKCAYCDFVSFSDKWDLLESYAERLCAETAAYRGLAADTVYFGGGTPSSVPIGLIEKIFAAVHKNFIIEKNAEITFEANPKTAGLAYFRRLSALGVNRLSVGAQSFCGGELKILGRLHTVSETESCFRMAREAGFRNINLDLMFGLPTQTKETLSHSLAKIAALQPEHVSCYNLTLESDTPLAKAAAAKELILPDEDGEADLHALLLTRLEARGYALYEISNFSLAGFQSRHNMKYWRLDEYVGLGAAAHGYLGGERLENPSDLAAYLSGKPPKKTTESAAERRAAFLFLGLRTVVGVSEREFSERFGADLCAVYGKQMEKFLNLGVVKRENGRVFLTKDALRVSNSILCEFA